MVKVGPGAGLGHPARPCRVATRTAPDDTARGTGRAACGVPGDVAPASPRPPHVAASTNAPPANHSQVRARAALTRGSFHLDRSALTGGHGPASAGVARR